MLLHLVRLRRVLLQQSSGGLTSQSLHNAQYTNYLSDGDSKAYKTIVDEKVYDTTVEKLECTGHIRKHNGEGSSESTCRTKI